MTSPSVLSSKQKKILEFIESTIAETGTPPTLREIAKHFGYEAIGTVQGHIQALIKKGYLEKKEGLSRGIQLTYRSQSVSIPILGMIPAGPPIEALEHSIGSLPIQNFGRKQNHLYALKVVGDSMKDAGILEGDYVVVSPQKDANHGDIVVALLNGEVTVKYLEKKRNSLKLVPANPAYQPIDLLKNALTEPVIQGRVIGVQRYFF